MADVVAALQSVRSVGFKPVGPLNSLLPKEELLNVLLENEQNKASSMAQSVRRKIWSLAQGAFRCKSKV
jgi:predicted Mrr-cat superfamily restriction endonuclease